MTSVTMMKYPDGRTETINVLSHFVKNNADVMVFDTDKIDNGHKVVGVSYLMDGMYQNIVGSAWDEIKGYLVDILHDRIGNEDYRVVPEDILVTADPYHPLGLREENRDKIIASYESFIASGSTNNVQNDNNNINQENISGIEQQNVMMQPVEGTDNQVVDNNIVDVQGFGEPTSMDAVTQPIFPEQVINEEINMNNNIVMDNVPVNENQVVTEEPMVNPEVNNVNMNDIPVINNGDVSFQPESFVQSAEVIPEIPIINNITDNNSLNTNINNDNNPNLVSQPEMVAAPIPEPGIIESTEFVPEPVIGNIEQPVVTQSDDSIVTNNYMNNIESIKQEILQLTNEYVAKIQSLSDEYTKNMDEKKMKIKEYLEEAKDYRNLAEQTLNKVQEVQAMNTIQSQNGENNVA